MKHWMRKLAALLAAVVLSGTLVACNTANSKVDSPYIGENGNWWVGTTDSGIKAAGEPGSDGAQGEKGDKGDTGAQGEKGDTGATGRVGFVVDSAVALLTAARVPNSYIILMNDITLEDGVIEATPAICPLSWISTAAS